MMNDKGFKILILLILVVLITSIALLALQVNHISQRGAGSGVGRSCTTYPSYVSAGEGVALGQINKSATYNITMYPNQTSIWCQEWAAP